MNWAEWADDHVLNNPGHIVTASSANGTSCQRCGATPSILPAGNVREAAERFQHAMDEVRRASRSIENEIREMEIYAREQAGDVELMASARKAYRDMADRLKALLGG